jgi:hypothetical protein
MVLNDSVKWLQCSSADHHECIDSVKWLDNRNSTVAENRCVLARAQLLALVYSKASIVLQYM